MTRDNITRDIFMWWNLFQEMHNCGGQWAVLQRWCREQRRLIVTTVCSARSLLGEKGWKSDLEWNANFKKSTHPRQPWFITKLKETVEWFQTDRCSGRVRRGWSNIYVWLPTDRRGKYNLISILMFNIPYESVDYFTNRYIFTFYFVGGLA